VIYLPDDKYLGDIPGWEGVCAGKRYEVTLDNNKDYIIRHQGTQPIRYPVAITGGRNVHILGLEIDLVVQPGCGVGQQSQPNTPGGKNRHPLLPGGMALRVEQVMMTYVE